MPQPILSCYTNAYGPAGVWEAVARIPDTGLRHVELALRPHNMGGLVIPEEVVLTEQTDDDTAARFVAHLKTHGVTLSGCNIGGADLATPEGLAVTERRLHCAHRWFGTTIAVSGAGQPQNQAERLSIEANLRRLGDVAGSLGMVLALETHKGPTQNAAAMRTLMSALDHQHIRINFDTGNIAYYNRDADPVAELRQIIDQVANVHLKDNRGRFEDWYFPALGDAGAVDFTAIREVLEAADYSGACTIEIEGIAGEPEPPVEVRHDRVQRSVDHLRSCGYL